MTLAQKPSFFGKMQQKIEDVILLRPKIDEEMLEDLEEVLNIFRHRDEHDLTHYRSS